MPFVLKRGGEYLLPSGKKYPCSPRSWHKDINKAHQYKRAADISHVLKTLGTMVRANLENAVYWSDLRIVKIELAESLDIRPVLSEVKDHPNQGKIITFTLPGKE